MLLAQCPSLVFLCLSLGLIRFLLADGEELLVIHNIGVKLCVHRCEYHGMCTTVWYDANNLVCKLGTKQLSGMSSMSTTVIRTKVSWCDGIRCTRRHSCIMKHNLKNICVSVEQIPSSHAVIHDTKMIARAIDACQKDHMVCATSFELICTDSERMDTCNFRCEKKRWTYSNDVTTREINIPCGQFQPGMKVTVVAIPLDVANFTLYLVDDVGDAVLYFIAVHSLNTEFKAYLSLNTKIRGLFGTVVIIHVDYPFVVARKFALVITMTWFHFEVFVNRKKYFTFPQRKTNAKVTKLVIMNGIITHSIEFTAPVMHKRMSK